MRKANRIAALEARVAALEVALARRQPPPRWEMPPVVIPPPDRMLPVPVDMGNLYRREPSGDVICSTAPKVAATLTFTEVTG